MIDPLSALSVTERHVFGPDARRHPLLGFVIEQGSGALPVDEQARQYVQIIEHTEGKAAADAMRVKLAAATRQLAIVKT